MRRWLWVIAGGFLGLTACGRATIHGVTPIYPKVGLRPPTVESLRPTFRWEPVAEPDARYDFITYESHELARWEWAIGKEVYYREGLKEAEHKLEVLLQPNRAYYWSMRVRRGEIISDWSRFDYSEYLGCFPSYIPLAGCGEKYEFPFFLFRTPAK